MLALPLALGVLYLALVHDRQRDAKIKERRASEKPGDRRRRRSKKAVEEMKKKIGDGQKKAARRLVRLVQKNKDTADRVRKLQKRMGAIPLSGKVDARTRLRVVELLGPVKWGKRGEPKAVTEKSAPPDYLALLFDVPFDQAPAAEPKKLPKRRRKKKRRQARALPPAEPTPKPRTRALLPTRTAAPPAEPVSKALPAPEPEPETEVTPEQEAALALYEYLRGGGKARSTIAGYQRKMLRLDPDGIPGPKTKARASQLLGRSVTWTAITPTGEPTAPADPVAAANELANYLTTYGGARRDRIKPYQAAMGGLVADGIAGRKTKARIEELTGRRV